MNDILSQTKELKTVVDEVARAHDDLKRWSIELAKLLASRTGDAKALGEVITEWSESIAKMSGCHAVLDRHIGKLRESADRIKAGVGVASRRKAKR